MNCILFYYYEHSKIRYSDSLIYAIKNSIPQAIIYICLNGEVQTYFDEDTGIEELK